jgi:biotin-(acetyl-CoA carboxylase) ligase
MLATDLAGNLHNMARPSVTFDLTSQNLSLPPVYRLKTVREAVDAFQTAIAHAGEGAGLLTWARRFRVADFAVVLEPEQPLKEARLAFYAGMNALYDTLSVYAPPEKPIAFEWPDTILVDGGVVGGARLAWPVRAAEDEPPAWMVFGVKIRLAARAGEEPGRWTRGTSLEVEGFEDFTAGMLVESFSRHFMAALHDLEGDGARQEIERYLQRLDRKGVNGILITGEGDCMIRQGQRSERRGFIAGLAQPSWRDPKTGEPWL